MLRRSLLLALALAASGCDGCVDLEGESIVAGSFVGLTAFEAAPGDIVIAALQAWDGTRGELVVVHVDGEICSAGLSAGYAPLASGNIGEGFVGYASFDGDDVGTVRFVDFACAPRGVPIEGVTAPVRLFPSTSGRLYLVSGDGAWWAVDPGTGDATVLAGPMSAVLPAGVDAYWVLEGGTLSVRDLDGNVVREAATGVTELSYPPFDATLVDVAAVYVDAAGVELVRGPDDTEPELLAADACAPHPLFADGAALLGYLAPCAEQQLVLEDVATGAVTPIASGVSDFEWDIDPLYFVTAGEVGAPVGDLYVRRGTNAPALVTADADLRSLEQHDYDTPPYALVLTQPVGDVGTLLRIAEDGSTETWHGGVAQFDDLVDHIAVLADFDGTTGNLYLHPEAGGEPELLAGGVPLDGFELAWQLPAIGYIADAQAGAGRLVVRELDGSREQEVDDGVTEFAEVLSDERPGVAYLIGAGERAGIWYAEP